MIDRVVLTAGETSRELSLGQFLELPLHERIQLILERAVTFYSGDHVIDRQDAMRYLRNVNRSAPG